MAPASRLVLLLVSCLGLALMVWAFFLGTQGREADRGQAPLSVSEQRSSDVGAVDQPFAKSRIETEPFRESPEEDATPAAPAPHQLRGTISFRSADQQSLRGFDTITIEVRSLTQQPSFKELVPVEPDASAESALTFVATIGPVPGNFEVIVPFAGFYSMTARWEGSVLGYHWTQSTSGEANIVIAMVSSLVLILDDDELASDVSSIVAITEFHDPREGFSWNRDSATQWSAAGPVALPLKVRVKFGSSESQSIEAMVTETPFQLSLKAHRKLRVRVVDAATGDRIESATVRVTSFTPPRDLICSGESDSDGEVSLRVPNRPSGAALFVMASKEGFSPGRDVVYSSTAHEFTIALLRHGLPGGTIRLQNGLPLAGMHVFVPGRFCSLMMGRTDGDGRYALAPINFLVESLKPSSPPKILTQAPLGVFATNEVAFGFCGRPTWIELAEGTSVILTEIVDANLRIVNAQTEVPEARARIRLIPRLGEVVFPFLARNDWIEADADGYLTCSVLRGGDWSIEIQAAGADDSVTQQIVLEGHEVQIIRFDPGRKMTIKLVDDDGLPVAGVTLGYSLGGSAPTKRVSDDSGQLVIPFQSERDVFELVPFGDVAFIDAPTMTLSAQAGPVIIRTTSSFYVHFKLPQGSTVLPPQAILALRASARGADGEVRRFVTRPDWGAKRFKGRSRSFTAVVPGYLPADCVVTQHGDKPAELIAEVQNLTPGYSVTVTVAPHSSVLATLASAVSVCEELDGLEPGPDPARPQASQSYVTELFCGSGVVRNSVITFGPLSPGRYRLRLQNAVGATLWEQSLVVRKNLSISMP